MVLSFLLVQATVVKMIGILAWELKRPDLVLEAEGRRDGELATALYAGDFVSLVNLVLSGTSILL
jgi:hypothetical protein